MTRLFYLQDSRTYVGNDVVWWAKNGKGYTTDLRKAEIYTEAKVQEMHYIRPTDIPWPKEYIDDKTRPAVDMQYIKREEALVGTSIVLAVQPRQRKESLRCVACGSFLNQAQFWSGNCPRCGGDSRP